MRYTIKEGDTLSALAKKHNTTVAVLATANMIADPNKIYAGREIWLPGGSIFEAPSWWETVRKWLWQ